MRTTIQHVRATDPPKNYRPDIDGLRAIAVLLVLIFHFSLFPVVTAGFIGVDVFFVISGFLITGILHRQLNRSEFGFAAFYIGRIRRLAPALVVTLVGTFCVGLCILFPDDLRELARQILMAQAYAANIYFWRTVNYFGLNEQNVFLLHTWSLAVEEQFYLLYPVLLVLLHRYAPRRFWLGIGALFTLSFLLNIGLVSRKPEAVFYLLPTRAWELLAGALTMRLMVDAKASRGMKQWLAALGLLCIAAGAVAYRPEYRFPGLFAVLPVLGTSLVLFSHDVGGTAASRLLEWAPLRYIGRISYPLYLVHWPIHVFASRVLGARYDSGAHVAMLVASVLAAAAIYHFVENPVRHGRWFMGRRPLVAVYLAAVSVTLLAVGFAEETGGLPSRFPAEVVRLANYVNDKTPPLIECEFDGKSADLQAARLCRIGSATAIPRWAVIGDSHAWATHDAFDLWLKSRNESAFFVFRHGCAPLADVHLFRDDGTCFKFNKAVDLFMARTASVDSIALVSTWRQGRERLISVSERSRPSDERSRELFRQGLGAEIDRLKGAGKRVYVWEPLPGARSSVPLAMAAAAQHGTSLAIDKSRDEYLTEYDFFFQELDALGPKIDGTFSSAAVLCASGSCKTSVGGVPLYFDNSHPTRSSASYFSDILKRTSIK